MEQNTKEVVDGVLVTPEVEENKKIEITEDIKEVLLCCYGTLRLGRGNYQYLLEGRSEYLGTFKTEPTFTMYGKGCGFPIVSPNGDTAITYDLFKVRQNAVLDRIHRLEGCTGIPGDSRNWYDIMPIQTPYGVGYIYVQNISESNKSVIKSGNWDDK